MSSGGGQMELEMREGYGASPGKGKGREQEQLGKLSGRDRDMMPMEGDGKEQRSSRKSASCSVSLGDSEPTACPLEKFHVGKKMPGPPSLLWTHGPGGHGLSCNTGVPPWRL